MTLYEVKHRLTTTLRLAESWNAIVLVDEADVFLARRELGDIKRNALVSSKQSYSGCHRHHPPRFLMRFQLTTDHCKSF